MISVGGCGGEFGVGSESEFSVCLSIHPRYLRKLPTDIHVSRSQTNTFDTLQESNDEIQWRH